MTKTVSCPKKPKINLHETVPQIVTTDNLTTADFEAPFIMHLLM